ncbi:uncharacterized protein DC041_0000276 [Schistosoma bovis]|uniref:Peptidase A1 domain-containing protein n=1 Tax=Schistosoma bovis TaxID=6184 RepID=A0A430QEA4_SCHBO|nr:uncharacterized protein DC041_0000276 [Schistosoma bovis]
MEPFGLGNNMNDNKMDLLLRCRENGTSFGGEMVLGGVNPEYFEGDLEYMPTVNNNIWAVRMSSNVNLTSILKSPTSIAGHSPPMIGLIEDAGDSGQSQMGGMQFD